MGGDCCYFVCLQRAETGLVREVARRQTSEDLVTSRIVDKRLSWQEAFSVFLVAVRLGLGT